MAYLLPILSVVGPLRGEIGEGDSDGGECGKKLGIEAVIVAPSRELGMQIVREFEKVLGMDNKRVVQLMGKTVLAASSDVFSPSLRTYAHCSKGRVSALSSYYKINQAKEH